MCAEVPAKHGVRARKETGDVGRSGAALPRLWGCQPEAVLSPVKGFQAGGGGGTGWAGGACTDFSNDRLPASHLGAEHATQVSYSNQLSFSSRTAQPTPLGETCLVHLERACAHGPRGGRWRVLRAHLTNNKSLRSALVFLVAAHSNCK